ncbi:hypothetical protein J4E91_005498 [Alternaria rosae]|nr:hypothetical protein J4E91_005498 [Alternaria rosae]
MPVKSPTPSENGDVSIDVATGIVMQQQYTQTMNDSRRHFETMIEARIAELESAKTEVAMRRANLQDFQTQVNTLKSCFAALKQQNYAQYLYIADTNNTDTAMDHDGPLELPPLPLSPLCDPPDYKNILAAKDTGTNDTDQLHQGERDYDCDSDVSSDDFEYEERRRKIIAELIDLYKKVGISSREIAACEVREQECEKITKLLRRHIGLLEQAMRFLKQLAFDVEEDDPVVDAAIEAAMGDVCP